MKWWVRLGPQSIGVSELALTARSQDNEWVKNVGICKKETVDWTPVMMELNVERDYDTVALHLRNDSEFWKSDLYVDRVELVRK